MTPHRPFSRKARHPRYVGLEALESRVLLDSTLIPVTDHRELIVDSSRNQLLIIGTTGTINRYDLSSNQLLSPINLGFAPGGADITPDGQYLYITRITPSLNPILTRVDLTTNVHSDFPITTLNANAGFFDCAVLADGRVELTTVCDSLPEAFIRFNPASSSFTSETLLNTPAYPVYEPASIFTSADRQTAFFVEPHYNGDAGGARIFKYGIAFEWQANYNFPIANPVFGAVNSNGVYCAFAADNRIYVNILGGTAFSVPTLSTSGGIAFSSDSQRLYTVDPSIDALRIFDISNSNHVSQITQLPIGEDVTTDNFNGRLTLSPDGSRFFVTTAAGIRILRQPAHQWTASTAINIPASAPLLGNTPFTATISSTDSNAGSAIPTGLAYFYDTNGNNTVFLGTAPLVNGVASFTSNSLSLGVHHVFATYGGDANFSAAVAATSDITITKANPQITVAPIDLIADGVVATNITAIFTATFAPASLLASNEQVSLWDATTNTFLGYTRITNGTVTFYYSPPAEREYNLRIDYPGNSNLNATSAFFSFVAQKAATSLDLILPTPDSYILTAQITPVSSIIANYSLAPYGTVSVLENDHVLTTVNAASILTFNLSSLTPGPHTLTVTYSGSDIYAGDSETSTISVRIPTTTALQLSPALPILNKPLTLSAAVSPAVSGTVTFFDNNTPIGSAPVSQGAAAFTFTPNSAGNHTYLADFIPDGNYLETSASASAYICQPTTIDILALYSNQELQAAGSIDTIRTQFLAQIDDTNTVLANSGLALSVRLAALAPADYNESGDLNRDWLRLSKPGDHYLDQVAALRNRVGGDLVVLLDSRSPVSKTDPTEIVEGVGSMLSTYYWGWSDQDKCAYIVLSQAAPRSEYTLAHEIGHTFGIAHAADDPGGKGIIDDAYGYRVPVGSTTYRDVMAYQPGTIVPCYSNPSIIQSIGVAMGQAGTANAARVISITGPTVADYRTAVPFGAITAADASSLSGWVLDPKSLTAPSTIRIDIDGFISATLQADDPSATLLAQYGDADHAFTYQLPNLAPGRHTIKLYALDAVSGNSVLIATRTVTAHHLAWTLQTPSIIAGQSPTFSLAVKDTRNSIVSDYQATLTLAIYSGPAGGTLTGTLSAPVVNGVATFDAFTLTKAGNYTLRASDGFLSLKSGRLSVLPDAASAHLVLVSPADPQITVGKTFAPIIFNVQDQFANLVTSNRTPISLSLLNSPANSSLSGTTTLTTRAGVAKFTNLRAIQSGTYTLSAVDSALPLADSVQFTLTCLPATTTARAPRPASRYLAGKTITLSNTLLSTAPTTIPFTGTLTLADATDTILAIATLSATGSAKFLFPTPAPGIYSCHLDYSGDLNHAPATSNSFTLTITA
jgi:hypothetical protein